MTAHNTSSLFDIAGKIVLITGATGGLGEAAARGLAQIGANVMLTARSQDKLASIAASIVQEEGAAAYAAGRPDDAGDVRRVVEATVERFGGIDVLITTAGTNHLHPIIHYPLKAWEKVIDVNVKGTCLACKEAGRVMIKQGRGGKVILIASARGALGMANTSAYVPCNATI